MARLDADRGRRGRSATAGRSERLAVLLLAGMLAPNPAAAQVADSLGLDGSIVRRIDIRACSIFEPLPDRGRPLYALANRLHVVTRPHTLRAAFVFREGEPWSEAKRIETLRHLRSLPYLVPDTLVAIPVGRDSVDVRVVTHDNWTTSPEFSVESGGGQQFGSVSLVERNLLGLGTSLSLVYRSDVTGISRVARIEDEELFGSHWHGRLSYGGNDGGDSHGVLLALPFWADATPRSMGAHWASDVHNAELFSDGEVVSSHHVRAVTGGIFWGAGAKSSRGSIQRIVGSLEWLDRTIGAAVLKSGAPAEFARAADTLRERLVAVQWRHWRPRYLVRRGIDLVDRDEDIDVGTSVLLKAGFSPAAFGSTRDAALTRAQIDVGLDTDRSGFGQLTATVQARWRPRAREVIGVTGARWVVQPRDNVTAVAGVMGIGGRDMPPDFQVTLGGITGLRAFPVHELTGTQFWRGNGELRWIAARDVLRLVSLGGAAFWDTGRTWGPGSGDTLWHHDVGFGLRLSLPHSAMNAVARFDVAWPVSPGHEARHGPAYSFGSGQAF